MALLLSLWLLTITSAQAELPVFAKEYLNKIPGKKLSLPYVVGMALENAEVYKNLGYQYASADIEYLAVESVEDWRLTGGANYFDESTVKTSPFQAVRVQGWDWNLGISKSFSSGTTLSTGWKHSFIDTELSAQLLSFGALAAYKETRATVGLTQNLLKNSFGYGYRKKLRAARDRGEALKSKTRFDIEKTTMGFMQLFYQAWLKQQRVLSVQKQLKRRERLLRVTRRKRERGVVEKPEILQVQALVASTRADLRVARSDLHREWETLVINLKLPKEFLSVNPIDIPTVLDSPMATGVRVCLQGQPQTTAEIVSFEKTLKASESALDASKNEALPELNLIAGYEGNGIDGGGRPKINKQILEGDGPSWKVGLVLNWPLDNSASQSERRMKWLEKARAEAQIRMARDKLQTDWLDLCRRLKVERENEKIFNDVVKQQIQRVSAENRRFSLGRLTVDRLIAAEDDLGNWEFRSQQQSVSTRIIAWQVQALSGELYRQIQDQVEKGFKAL